MEVVEAMVEEFVTICQVVSRCVGCVTIGAGFWVGVFSHVTYICPSSQENLRQDKFLINCVLTFGVNIRLPFSPSPLCSGGT